MTATLALDAESLYTELRRAMQPLIPPYFNVANEQEDVKFTYYKLSNGTATKVQEKYIEIKTSRRPYKP